MERYTREQMITIDTQLLYTDCVKYCKDVLSPIENGWVIFEWQDAPVVIKYLCYFAGGDEDWVIVTSHEIDSYFFERMCVHGEPDLYLFDDFVIYVSSH